MGRFLFLSLLCVVSSSAFALFPVQIDWQVNHLQGKVKSVVYHAEDNPETVDGKMMTTDTAHFYNEQGFLIKTEVKVGESKSADKITAIYRYDKQHRLKEVHYGMDKDTYAL